MKMITRLSVSAVAITVSLASISASALANDSGVYLRGNAGLGLFSESTLTGDMVSNVHGNNLRGGSDLALSLGVGYEFDNRWRLELDGDTIYSDLGSIGQTPSTFAKLRTDSLMLNALYDFDGLGRFEPYIGAGLGFVRADASLAAHDFSVGGVFAPNPVCLGARVAGQAYSCEVQDKDTAFGWQLLAGVGLALSDRLTWDTHYTYQNAGDFDLDGIRLSVPANSTTPINTTLSDVASHSVVTGLRYRFGSARAPKAIVTPPTPPIRTFTCWDGTSTTDLALCAPEPAPEPVVEMFACWDGSTVSDLAACPVQPAPAVQTFTCPDNVTVVSDLAACPVVQRAQFNICGPSPVNIFDVPANANFEQLSRLGTMPEFGDSHGLTPTQFYNKLDARYKSSATDKAYLNYLFTQMGYANGWRDARPDMFSETVLPVGTRGILGLGEQHHFGFHVLPTSERDREAFRIQSANGTVIHFMKTCGNYMYACE